MSEPILVLGAGAVGAYVGGHMANNGIDVILADPWGAHIEEIRANGLRLQGVTEEEAALVKPETLHFSDLQSLIRRPKFKTIFISMKSYDTDWMAQLAKVYLADDGCVVSLQNAINEQRIADIVGQERTVGCIASKIVVELIEPGFVERRVKKGGADYTVFRVGEMDGVIRPRTEWLADAFSKVDSAKVTDNLGGERWSKLVQNVMANCVAAATGLPNKAAQQNENARKVTIRLAGEAIRIGLALGHQLEPVSGYPAEKWLQAADALAEKRNDAPEVVEILDQMAATAQKMSDKARPSMAQDVAKGRRTEIHELNGEVVRRGKELDLPCEVNAAMVEVVDKIDQGQIGQALENLPQV